MQFRSRSFRRPAGLVSAALLALVGPLATAGFENGEVYANTQEETGGMTTFADETLNMQVVAPPPSEPPPPPSFAPALSSLNGTMRSVALHSSGSITGIYNQLGSVGTALVDFVDSLVVEAEDVPAGTDLIIAVTWRVTGNVEFGSTSSITNRSKILLESPGVQLDPDPEAPDPPKQVWTRDISNFSPERLDPFGLVSFEYLVKAEEPVFDGNIRLRMVAGFVCGGPGSIFVGSYNADCSADLTVEFVGATSVRTTDGIELYKWTTNAHSGLSYGSRDDDPPSNPTLNVAPSSAGPKFSRLSWQTVASEYYLVQASTDGTSWTTVTEVLGTGGTVGIDVIIPAPSASYRLVSRHGSGSPSRPLAAPEMCLFRNAAGNVVVAWQTDHWENYTLKRIGADGNSTASGSAQGDGGAVLFEFPPAGAPRIFQIEATLK